MKLLITSSNSRSCLTLNISSQIFPDHTNDIDISVGYHNIDLKSALMIFIHGRLEVIIILIIIQHGDLV